MLLFFVACCYETNETLHLAASEMIHHQGANHHIDHDGRLRLRHLESKCQSGLGTKFTM